MTNKNVRAERVFQTLAPITPYSLAESLLNSFQKEIMTYTCDVRNFKENTWILFEKPKHAVFKFNIEIPIQIFNSL